MTDFTQPILTPSGEAFTDEDGKPLTLGQAAFFALRCPPSPPAPGHPPQPLTVDEVVWRDRMAYRVHAGDGDMELEDRARLRNLIAASWSLINVLVAGRAVALLD